jgi:hypothetical protein
MVLELEKSIEFMSQNKETRHNEFKGFSDFEISKVQRLVDWIKSENDFNKDVALKNFYLYFQEQDRRRNTNFLETFPELVDFWSECEHLSNKL